MTVTLPPPRSRLLSSVDVGNVNRGRILQALLQSGPTSRAGLARMVAVPRGTVGVIVSNLIDEELLEEVPGSLASTRGPGKPATPVWFTRTAGLAGAIALNSGVLEIAVANAQGAFLHKASHVLPDFSRSELLDEWVAHEVTEFLGPIAARLSGVAVVVPAWCDPVKREVLRCTPLPALEGTRLPALLEDSLGAKCLLEQDARAFALGERWFGQCRTTENFAAIMVDVGVGGAVVYAGRLNEGSHVPTMQLGHICVDLHGSRCPCGLRGCFETIASLRWLRAEARRRGVAGHRDMTVARLRSLADARVGGARSLLIDYAKNIAVGLAVVVQLMGIPQVVLHGDVVHGGDVFRKTIERGVADRTLPVFGSAPVVSFSTLDHDAALLGAAAAVLSLAFGLTL